MKHTCVTATFVAVGALLTAGQTLTQVAHAATTVAHVYLSTASGVDLYDSDTNGKMTLVKGSPFKVAGTYIEAATSSKLFTMDANKVYTYAVASSGVIGAEVGSIDTRDFDGTDCSGSAANSSTYKAVLDHTGKSLYVQVFGYATVEGGTQAVCSAYQSYQVGSTGKLTFIGAYTFDDSCCTLSQFLSFSSSDKYAYGLDQAGTEPATQYFIRESSGALEKFTGSEEAPPQPTGSTKYTWTTNIIDADPSGHAAVMGIFLAANGASTGRKIASYTIGGSGDLTTSNTYAELVTPTIYPNTLNFSPSGSYLAAAGSGIGSGGGLQIFHWNGSKPPTAYGSARGSSDVLVIHWDNNNHLYAAGDDNKLHIYTVTSTGISEASGSPLSLSSGLEGAGMIVVPVS